MQEGPGGDRNRPPGRCCYGAWAPRRRRHLLWRGQRGLGLAGTALAFVTLFALDYFDQRIPRQHRARLLIEAAKDARLTEMADAVAPKRFKAHLLQQAAAAEPDRVRLGYEIVGASIKVEGAPSGCSIWSMPASGWSPSTCLGGAALRDAAVSGRSFLRRTIPPAAIRVGLRAPQVR
jgi:hypothetical protein